MVAAVLVVVIVVTVMVTVMVAVQVVVVVVERRYMSAFAFYRQEAAAFKCSCVLSCTTSRLQASADRITSFSITTVFLWVLGVQVTHLGMQPASSSVRCVTVWST